MTEAELVTSLDKVIGQFSEKLAIIEKSGLHSTQEHILQVLLARDAVQADLEAHRDILPHKAYLMLQLDNRLRKQASLITRLVNLDIWRATFRPPAVSWWWSFESVIDRPDRFGWIWSSLTALLLTLAVSLFVDTSSRLLKGNPDTVGTFAVISQGLLFLLTAGGVLTQSGREVIDRVFFLLSVPRFYWTRLKAVITVILFLLSLGLRIFLPSIAIIYNNLGLENYRAGQITSALSNYNRAIALFPDYAEAHYNLAVVYEDQQDLVSAISEYRIAAMGNLDAAYNNLARLYILQDAPANAISLLLNSLDRVEDPQIRYAMLKNMGWARVKQGRFNEAETYLRSALDLYADKAPAHCLMAQVLDGQKRPDEALDEWNNCLKYASIQNVDEDSWIAMARIRLENLGGPKP
jgi:tetratricopeptide (TPR) repeat protein